jgi:hypothetical protein
MTSWKSSCFLLRLMMGWVVWWWKMCEVGWFGGRCVKLGGLVEDVWSWVV